MIDSGTAKACNYCQLTSQMHAEHYRPRRACLVASRADSLIVPAIAAMSECATDPRLQSEVLQLNSLALGTNYRGAAIDANLRPD